MRHRYRQSKWMAWLPEFKALDMSLFLSLALLVVINSSK